MEGELDKKACQNSLISFGLHSSPFIAKREEPTWASVSFLMEEDNGEEPKLVPMQIVLKVMRLVHFVLFSWLVFSCNVAKICCL
jgi:hypothetical protein